MQKFTPFWRKMLKIALASWAPPQTLLGSLRVTTLPSPPSREGLLAFGACTFPNFLKICPPTLYIDFRLWAYAINFMPIIETSDFSHNTAAKANASVMLNFTIIEEHLNIKK